MKTKKITPLNIILAFVLTVSSTLILLSSCTNTDTSTPDIPENLKAIENEIAAAMTKETEEPTTEEVDPYAHVRFGETQDILLLDIEWHTYDTYLEEIVEPLRKKFEGMQDSDELKDSYKSNLEMCEQNLNLMDTKRSYVARTINGKYYGSSFEGFTLWDPNIPIDISEYLDEDGYYIYNIYPYYNLSMGYNDENGEFQYKQFSSDGSGVIHSKSEFDNIMKEQVIPFCDDLLAKKLIGQEFYDSFTTKDPLDEYVETYFS